MTANKIIINIFLNNKSIIEKLKIIAGIRYVGEYIDVAFVSVTDELAQEISKWSEVDSIELEEKSVLFQN
jgi:hypothetical protein